MIQELTIGDRFTAGHGRYDKRIWVVMEIDDQTMFRYSCQAEGTFVPYHNKPGGSYDWYFLTEQGMQHALKSREIKVVDEKGNVVTVAEKPPFDAETAFTKEESDAMKANMARLEAAMEWLPEDEPIPYDIGEWQVLEETAPGQAVLLPF